MYQGVLGENKSGGIIFLGGTRVGWAVHPRASFSRQENRGSRFSGNDMVGEVSEVGALAGMTRWVE